MSGDRLNRDQVAALVEAAKQGQLPDQPSGARQRRGQRLRTVDFSRPTKFTSDLQRRITRAIDTFCQTSVTRLSDRAAHRDRARDAQHHPGHLVGGAVPAARRLAVGDARRAAARDPDAVHASSSRSSSMCLDCLLGGSPDKPPRERRFSEIDTMLTQRLIESMVHQMSLVWQDLAGIRLSIIEIETYNDASQIAAVSEPTLVVMVESRINKHSASMGLLIPWLAIDPVADQLSGKETREAEADLAGAAEIGRAVASCPSPCGPRWPRSSCPIDEILALGPGSLIKLGAQAEQGVTLFAENVKLARAQPGSNGPRRAIQVSGTERRFG